MSELLKREKMARALFEVGAPPHQFWDDIGLDKRELYLCMADAALSQGSSDHAPAALQVWYGPMPESNGKSNFTAILHKGDLVDGHTIARSEYPERVRYEADRVRFLIGELPEMPDVLAYDGDKHSGYVEPQRSAASTVEPVADPLHGLDERLDRLFVSNECGDGFVLSARSASNIVGIVREWIRAKSAAPTTSPEPDAVRDLAGVLAAELAPKFDAFLSNPGNPHLAADLRQWFWDNKSGVLAALSRPAHGDVVPKHLLDGRDNFIVSKGLWTEFTDTLARNDRRTGEPQS